ncbi:MAG: amino acid--tRNA ligase-related protein [Conexivisphaerales archaeon]
MARVHIQKEIGVENDPNATLGLFNTVSRYRLFSDKRIHSVARIEAMALFGARKYLAEKGFIEVTVPHLTKATGACENVATMFEVDFFGEKRYLAQTGQLYLEVLTPYLDKVFAIGPSFRAEPTVDGRHLVEFTLVEIEFKGSFDELLVHIEGIVYYMIKEVLQNCTGDLEILGVNIDRLNGVSLPFKRVTYSEAVEVLKDMGVSWGDDLKNQHEQYLVEYFGKSPLFVTHYPKEIKFFNMKQNELDSRIVNSADLLLPYSGEAAGAAEREYEYEKLLRRLTESSMLAMLKERGGNINDFGWYLNFYKEFGGCPHSGCGIGLNRVTQFIIGSKDIRECTVWPMNKETVS